MRCWKCKPIVNQDGYKRKANIQLHIVTHNFPTSKILEEKTGILRSRSQEFECLQTENIKKLNTKNVSEKKE